MRTMTLAAFVVCFVTGLAAQSTAPAELKWHKDVKPRVEEAVKLAATDPISSYLLFKNVLERGGRKPNAAQAAWLDTQMTPLQPRALEILQREYDSAAKEGDARRALLVLSIAESVAADALRREPPFEELRKTAIAGEGAAAIWAIHDLQATTSKGYSESGGMAFSVIVPSGHNVLRVKARVENVSSGSDAEYLSWGLGSLKRVMSAIYATSEPHRWIDEDLIWLVDPSGKLIACSAIADGSDLATIKMRTRSDKLVYPPRAVKRGESIQLDAVFVVPQQTREYRLYVSGAPPVLINLAP
ncbi:MAG TPA: hypothetical protein VMT00_08915 [Thermoanaerobaculia bacterium]|nr:hypothetical protein [Thermoanaerobaculia bacterium]